MSETLNYEKDNNSKTVVKNTIYNLLGYGVPLLIAIFAIPILVKILGKERFGILNLVWIVIGYFSFFDFGLGRTLTKIVAEKISQHKSDEIPSIFWTSLYLMLIISLLGTIIIFFFVPYLVNSFFNISPSQKTETIYTFYALAVSIPIVSTTAGIRGVLEAYQKFGMVNVIRTILGIFSFLGPLLTLIFVNSLFWIVVFLLGLRIIIWLLYLYQCFAINSEIKRGSQFNIKIVSYLLKFSFWITVANIVGPLLIYLDRFLIGALLSATAIAYYATPYEVISKLLLIPGALVVVLFPAFSGSYSNSPDFSRKLFLKGVKFIFLIIYPIVLLVVTFSSEGMNIWLGPKFAENSSFVLQILAIGILFNSLAHIPFNFFQGIGKPNIPAIVNLLELPFYTFFMWIMIKKWELNGAVIVWLIRILVDTAVLFYISEKTIKPHFNSKYPLLLTIVLMVGLLIPFGLVNLYFKFVFCLIMFSYYTFVTWKFYLKDEEKVFLVSRLKLLRFS